jgi:para-nitrobenzyl esterase
MGIVARTLQGEIEGREKDGALLFAGIPYAAPPIGARRFLPPEPHERWSGVRAAQRFGPCAPQLPGEGLVRQRDLRWDEDCLTLNVCTPGLDGGRRPVMVWIHGGGFQTGQGGIPWYAGASFARGGVVTVTINYRLGALGFAHVAEIGGKGFESAGLNGILDQIAAIHWVRDNIAAFGGDPERITIAGESAGAMSVGTLVGCPSARGLFRGAIAQSGAAEHVIGERKGREIAARLADVLRADSIEALRAKSPAEVLEAQRQVAASYAEESRGDPTGLGAMPFRPVVEGHVLPLPPVESVRKGNAADVALLVGTNADETTIWTYGEFDEAKARRAYARYLPHAETAYDTYRAARPGATPAQLVTAVTTDQTFRIPAVRLAEAQHAGGGRAFAYLFTWRSRAFGGRLGATHVLEIPFTFNTLAAPGVDAFLGAGPPPTDLADRIHASWTAFIHRGDPACDALPAWPAYDPSTRAVMELGEPCRLLHDPSSAERELWEASREKS